MMGVDVKQPEVSKERKALQEIYSYDISQVYWTQPTAHCPNSKLPILVYRNVLPGDLTEDSAQKLVEANNWYKGGTFKHYPTAHFHSNTHECYAALRGNTKCLYGVGPLDDEKDGVSFDMKAGDIGT
jgi:uncharacterized protein YjlB